MAVNFVPLYTKIDELLNNYSRNNELAHSLIQNRLSSYIKRAVELYEKKYIHDGIIVVDYALMELPMCIELLYIKARFLIEEKKIELAVIELKKIIGRSKNEKLVEEAKSIIREIQ